MNIFFTSHSGQLVTRFRGAFHQNVWQFHVCNGLSCFCVKPSELGLAKISVYVWNCWRFPIVKALSNDDYHLASFTSSLFVFSFLNARAFFVPSDLTNKWNAPIIYRQLLPPSCPLFCLNNFKGISIWSDDSYDKHKWAQKSEQMARRSAISEVTIDLIRVTITAKTVSLVTLITIVILVQLCQWNRTQCQRKQKAFR